MVFRSIIFLLSSVPCWMVFFIRPQWQEIHINGNAQGTTYHITYYTRGKSVTHRQIDSLLKEVDRSLSIYDPQSLISRFNRSARGMEMDTHLNHVVHKSLEVKEATGGIFDITVLPLMTAWGFGTGATPGAGPAAALSPIPETTDAIRIRTIMTYVGSAHLKVQNGFLAKDNANVKIDVNGIAQGYSVDVVAAFLERHSIRNYLVEIGGELRVCGHKQPENTHFKIGIEAPAVHQNDDEVIKRIVEIKHGAITTSGNYRNYHLNKGRKISHLLDARTGYPIDNELIAVTVWAQDAITADGFDNALMGMGLKNAFAFLQKKKHMEAYFIYRRTSGEVTDTCTTGFLPFFKQD